MSVWTIITSQWSADMATDDIGLSPVRRNVARQGRRAVTENSWANDDNAGDSWTDVPAQNDDLFGDRQVVDSN